ncbi:MAG: glycosyltransferase family A protein [Patescibacteria group bacterium]
MTISVVVIAHNEERHINQCLESLINQTKKADQIVLITHNCTDKTEKTAKNYPVHVIPYNGPRGIVYARLEGLRHASGDIILCTDGDSYVASNWIEVMSHQLINNEAVLVGSWMKLKGTFFGWLSNLFNWYYCVRSETKIERWIWGPGMGFWGKDKSVVQEIFEKSIALTKELELTRNPDDFWLALFMKKRGKLSMTNKTHVTQHTKETTSAEVIKRSKENVSNAEKMERYFSTLS